MGLTRTSEVAIDREVEGDLFLQDIGQGFGFRPGSFDGAIRYETQFTVPCPATTLKTTRSISVLQWLLNAETSHPTSSPPHRLTRFFTTLHSALRNPSRAVLQFYPTSDDQVQLITSIAQKAGFGGGIVVDYPNSKKARKVFLCLFVGDGGAAAAQQQLPKGLEGESEDPKAMFEKRRQRETRREKSGKQKVAKGGRDWIIRKKEVRRSSLTVLFLSLSAFRYSYIGDEGRKTSLATPNTRVVKEKQSSRLQAPLHHFFCTFHS